MVQLPQRTPPPRTIGRYELLGELGRGGMGVVYRARDPRSGRVVAVKVLAPFASVSAHTRFRTEAAVVARLEHPSILPLLDAGEDGGRPFLVLPLVEGGSLGRRLASKGPLAVAEAVTLVRHLAAALDHAHRRGVLHRDVKPENVLLPADGPPLLVDFGLARDAEGHQGLTRTGQLLGTPGYWPPEQALGRAQELGPPADVYSAGATLWAALVGEPPFTGESLMDTLHATLTRPAAPPSSRRPEVDPALDAIVLRCLAKAPAERFRSAAELAAALEAWSPRAGGRRAPRLVAVGAVAVGLASLAGVAAAVARGRAGAVERAAPPTAAVASAQAVAGKLEREADALVARARARYDAGDLAGALVDLDAAAIRAAEGALAHQLRGLLAYQAGRREDAVAALVSASLLAPERADVWADLARARVAARHPASEALRDAERAVALAPRSVAALLARANARVTSEEAGVRRSALEDLDAVLALDARSTQALVLRGQLRLARRDDGGLADLRRAVELEARPALWVDVAARLSAHDRRQEALALLDRTLAAFPEEAAAFAERCRVRHALGDDVRAIVDGRRATVLAPGVAEHWMALGCAAQGTDLAAAERAFGRYVALRPDVRDGWMFRGNMRSGLGDLEGAVADYTRARALDPPHEESTLGMRAAARFRLRDYAGAVEDFAAALRINRRDGQLFFNCGNARFMAGDPRGAADDYAEAIRLEGGRSYAPWVEWEAHLARARARERLGDRAGAAEDLRRFLTLAPGDARAEEARASLARLPGP